VEKTEFKFDKIQTEESGNGIESTLNAVPVELRPTQLTVPIRPVDPEIARITMPGQQANMPVANEQVYVEGKFLKQNGKPFIIKGVTYGTFKPDTDGHQYPEPETVNKDFLAMKFAGVNTVRVYTVPPVWLLDTAAHHGLKVIIGLCWEQHIVDFVEQSRARKIFASVSEQVRQCNNHSAILAFTLGNEIPSSVVRWLGAKRVEKFLHRLFQLVKTLAPDSLITYVNFPPTEYLVLPFVDFVSFNVYLETQQQLQSYLNRLHNLAAEKPVLMAEIGLDSLRNGTRLQSEVLDWQLNTCTHAGLAGAIVFAWTDEWYRGGGEIEDWDFGLVERNRQAKPALTSVHTQFNRTVKDQLDDWPRVTVAICTYNGSRTLGETLQVLSQQPYPNFEVLVIDDGSTDNTRELALGYPCKVISTENNGLSSARNTAWQNAEGQIIAYLDDDAYPDDNWLYYIALQFEDAQVGAAGGPNLPPATQNDIAYCVSHSPGGPNHVLETDTIAEHIPGCNMAIRRQVLQELGGFDIQFRVAGDDVDMCWRIRDNGWVIKFSPSAVVFHHRRDSAKGYLRQQRGYGIAEALLANKYPGRVNELGHLSWAGVIYGKGLKQALGRSHQQIDYGVWGTGFYQSIYLKPVSGIFPLTLIPESLLVAGMFAAIGCLGVLWTPLYFSLIVAAIILTCLIIQGVYDTRSNLLFAEREKNRWTRAKCWWLTLGFHLFQPIARLQGRLKGGITPHRMNPKPTFSLLHNKYLSIWSENHLLPETVLTRLEEKCESTGLCVRCGTSKDRWDLIIGTGGCRKVKLLMAMEEHGGDKQMFRFKLQPHIPVTLAGLTSLGLALTIAALLAGSWLGTTILAAPTLYLLSLAFNDHDAIVRKQIAELCAEENMTIVSSSKLTRLFDKLSSVTATLLKAKKQRLNIIAKRS